MFSQTHATENTAFLMILSRITWGSREDGYQTNLPTLQNGLTKHQRHRLRQEFELRTNFCTL